MSDPKPDYLKNVPLMFAMNALWMFMVIMPVIVPFFESRGLSMTQIYQLQAIFGVALLLIEVPSGYVSDLMGRKNALIASCVFHGLGFGLFLIPGGFWMLVPAELLLAVAVSLYSGTDTALIYDSLEAAGSKKAPIKLLGRKVFYQSLGEALGGIVGGWLVYISLNANVAVQAVLSWLPILVVLAVHEPPRKLMDKRTHTKNAVYIWRSLFGHSRLLTLILLSLMFYSVATLVAVWTFQKDWQLKGIPIIYFGYLWAATNLSVAGFGRYAHKLEKRLGSSGIIVLMAILPVLGYFGMAATTAAWGVVFCLFFQAARGICQVILRDALNRRVTGDLRATANSVANLGTRALFLVLGPLMGHLIDTHGMSFALSVFGYFFIGCFFVLVLPLLAQRKSFQGA